MAVKFLCLNNSQVMPIYTLSLETYDCGVRGSFSDRLYILGLCCAASAALLTAALFQRGCAVSYTKDRQRRTPIWSDAAPLFPEPTNTRFERPKPAAHQALQIIGIASSSDSLVSSRFTNQRCATEVQARLENTTKTHE